MKYKYTILMLGIIIGSLIFFCADRIGHRFDPPSETNNYDVAIYTAQTDCDMAVARLYAKEVKAGIR
jgi:hypothetical protein